MSASTKFTIKTKQVGVKNWVEHTTGAYPNQSADEFVSEILENVKRDEGFLAVKITNERGHLLTDWSRNNG